MKDLGIMIRGMAKAMKGMQMGTSMKEISRTAKLMVEECTYGTMGKSMMESGRMDRRMVMVFGQDSMVIHTLASGRIVKQRAMACTHGRMETSMKVNG